MTAGVWVRQAEYREDQPRDDSGKWTSGDGGGGGSGVERPDWVTVPRSRETELVARHWAGDPGATNSIQAQADALVETGRPMDREAAGYSEASDPTYAWEATVLFGAIEQSPPDAPELYRGVALMSDPGYKVGGTTEFSLGSFTRNADWADKFAIGMLYPASYAVTFTLEPGSRSLDMNPMLEADRHFEQEWVTGGKFEITSVETLDGEERVRIEVGLRQVEVVKAP